MSASPAFADVQYVYDELGRLVQVIDPSGTSVQYTYDAAGNITAVRQLATTTLAITEFTPNAGPVGTPVTIYGTGFSTTGSQNTVKFNGTTTTVSIATATQLTVTVPAGATTGPISVTTSGGTATSAQSFTVTAGAPVPTITGFTPGSGAAGASVTITGTNFDTNPSNDKVRFNGVITSVSSATTTQVVTVVPSGTGSGRITLGTPNGSATSGSDFFVPPSGYTAVDIGGTGRTSINGTSSVLNTVTPGKIGLLLFDGTQGQSLGLGISNVTFSPTGGTATVYIKKPNGQDLMSAFSFNASGAAANLPPLPVTGTYTIVVVPTATSSVTLTATLSSDLGGTIVVDGPIVNVTTARAGQNARYTFSGSTGQRLNLVFNGISFTPASGCYLNRTVYKPDGSALSIVNGNSVAADHDDLPLLPASGTYQILIEPTGSCSASMNVWLSTPATGTVAVDGPSVTAPTTRGGQRLRYTFDAMAGQSLGLLITGIVLNPSGYSSYLTIYAPNGSNFYTNNSVGPSNADVIFTASSTGTYLMDLNPPYAATQTMTFTLSSALNAGTLTLNGAPVTTTTTRAGQNAYLTFNGVSGQQINLSASGSTFSTNPSVIIYKPAADGSASTSNSYVWNGSLGSGGQSDLLTLPVTGTYTVFVDPPGIITGSITLALTDASDVTGAITIDGAPVTFGTTKAAQRAKLTFSGLAGQMIGLGVTGVSFTAGSASASAYILKPDGLGLTGAYWLSGNGSVDTTGGDGAYVLPVTGTYTILFDPNGTGTGTATFTLSSDLSSTLNVDGTPTTVTTTRAGQNARLSFNGVAGQYLGLGFTGVSTTPSGKTIYYRVYKPDGTVFYSNYGLTSDGSDNFQPLPVTGTYSLMIDPYGPATVNITLTLSSDASIGTVVVDGASLSGNITRVGQNARATFAGTAGQQMTLAVTGSTISTGSMQIYKPDGTQLTSGSIALGARNVSLPVLPTTGTYTILVDPTGTSSGNFTLTLTTDLTGTITVDGAPTTVSTTRPAQRIRLTFPATAGQNLGYAVTGVTMNPAGETSYVTIFNPSGSGIYYNNSMGSAGDAMTLTPAATGTHTVLVAPNYGDTGTMTFTLSSDLNAGNLIIDGPPATVSTNRPAQNAKFTFAGTAGDYLGVGASDLVLTPSASATAAFTMYAPNGSAVRSCNTYPPACSFAVGPLAATGTYTIIADPSGQNTASFKVTLSRDIAGSLTMGGPSVNFATSRRGQNGRYTFSGTSGQTLRLSFANVTYTNATTGVGCQIFVTVYKPDGITTVASMALYQPNASGVLDIPPLTVTGNHLVTLAPQATCAASGLDMSLIAR